MTVAISNTVFWFVFWVAFPPTVSSHYWHLCFLLPYEWFPPTLPGKERRLLGLVLGYTDHMLQSPQEIGSDAGGSKLDGASWTEQVGRSAVSVFDYCSCGRCCLCLCCVFVSTCMLCMSWVFSLARVFPVIFSQEWDFCARFFPGELGHNSHNCKN